MRPIDPIEPEPSDEVEPTPHPSESTRKTRAARGRSDRIVVRFHNDQVAPPSSPLVRGLLYGVPISLALWALLLWLLL